MTKKLVTHLILALLLGSGLWLLATGASVLAQEPTFDQVNEVAQQLNCPTCVGINLSDCRTQTCTQWKDQIKDLLAEGYTEQEVLDYFVTQYGVQVLQEPPKSGMTLALWVLPFIALIAGGAWLFVTLRGWSNKTEPVAVEATAHPSRVSPQSGDIPDDYLTQVEKDLGIEEA